uniref:BrnA antitoxin of type II toxin-antitoxin system n=1 Tax=Candidatus Kentrum sp. FW TaxID=2126338 RepID=A0A450T3Y4_9GAMM|nr:MAG: BrnA antitoxin of type II toxin-antitoxin system [Candidatus Kentron sp. FW]VFJ61080.1 MAG: BrnA antitoxin of type II toxin-antitoxin system [Candidatus Kentron sp. FW]VFJ66125.1 MAG: BrnA antitoxin of type II toxin-antitoxin system [Candidatus Kentron sp. FW]
MKDEHTGNISESNPGTDWEKLRAMTDADIHAAIESDSDAMPTDEVFWESAQVVPPRRKETVTMQIDADVLEWFRRKDDYQVRINAILQDYMKAHVGV